MRRRSRGVAGLSLAATAGLLGAYMGYPGLRKAHATTTCQVTSTDDTTAPLTEGELRYCLNQLDSSGGGAITFAENTNGSAIQLNDHLPRVNLTSSITITGNGAGNTIIDGDGAHGFDFWEDSGTVSATLSGLTVQNANRGLTDGGTGGGVYAIGVDLDISDSTFSDNTALFFGGAIYSQDGQVAVTNSTLTSNKAYYQGGGIYADSGDVTVSNSTFTSNAANYEGGSQGEEKDHGGGIFAGSGDVTVTNSTFEDNTADENGGGIFTSSGHVTVTTSTFTGNTAAALGGAIRSYEGATVTNSTFTGNTATDGGGGAIYSAGPSTDVTVTDSTFTNNTATNGFGGAIYAVLQQSLIVRNSVFTGNAASSSSFAAGGAIYASMPDMTVTNSTFTGNTADSAGAAISADNNVSLNFVTVSGNTTSDPQPSSSGAVHSGWTPNGDGNATVTNSILFGNDGGDLKATGTLTASYSLFSSTSSVSPTVSGDTLIFGEDPLLGSLANNGGSTQTMLPAADSPVIGTANPVGAPATDQRGFSRTVDGLADMGAVQRAGEAPEPDPSQVPPSWHQANSRESQDAVCPPGMAPSWAQWPNEGTGGWTCEWTTWWDVDDGVGGGWVTTPGLRAGSMPGR